MQDVLTQFYSEYRNSYHPSPVQHKAVTHIINCKTGAYGANVSTCDSCGHKIFHNNSCRDRSCPMCQAISNEMWVDAQTDYVLDIDYYKCCFTHHSLPLTALLVVLRSWKTREDAGTVLLS